MTSLLLLIVLIQTPGLTPGKVDLVATAQVVCQKRYTQGRDVRHVTLSTKKEVFRRYGIDWAKHSRYEVDHLISLELGGANDIENLWPQLYCAKGEKGCFGAREKDVVETSLHRRVCSGELTLETAQQTIRTTWLEEYKRLKGL